MNKVKVILITLLCVGLVAACSANTNESTNNSKVTETPAVVETTSPRHNTDNETEANDAEVPAEASEVTVILESSLVAMQAVDKVELFIEEGTDHTYSEGPNQAFFYSGSLSLQRTPEIAREYIYRSSYNYVEDEEGSIDITDDSTIEYEYLYSKDDSLMYYTVVGEDNWFSDELWEGYKTVGILEDIVSYFNAHSTYAELHYDPVEGMELVEGETGEYRRIQLDLPTEQFVADTTKLTKYFINPALNQNEYLDQTYYLYSPELINHQLWIMLDESNRIIQYGVSYETTDYDNTMYTVKHYDTMYAMYEDSIEMTNIDITDEIKTMAEANTFPIE